MHLVGSFYEFYITMHGSINIKLNKKLTSSTNQAYKKKDSLTHRNLSSFRNNLNHRPVDDVRTTKHVYINVQEEVHVPHSNFGAAVDVTYTELL